jgi:diguanylate cyclase (GGDEF)-like protein
LEHGHRKIAFAGNLSHVDVTERHQGYLAAFAELGLVAPESLLFDTPHHKEADGRFVARQLLAMRLAEATRSPQAETPVTALVAATDRLALGAMSVLGEAGLRVPEDFGIVGFDDCDAAHLAEPPLTTVKQSFAQAAECAVSELLTAIRTQKLPHSKLRVPAQPIVRRSCGCEISHSAHRLSRPPPDRVSELTSELLAFASHNHIRKVTLLEWPEAQHIARVLDQGARGVERTLPVSGSFWTGYLEHKTDAENVVRVMELLESAFDSWATDDSAQRVGGGILRELRVALMHQWQRSERVKVTHYESVTEAAYRLASALSRSEYGDPARDLRWIRWSGAYRACCALWGEHAEASQSLAPLTSLDSHGLKDKPYDLRMAGEYTSEGNVNGRRKSVPIAWECFPPQELLEAADQAGTILSVASIPHGRDGEYGLLAVAAPLAFEQLEYVGTPADWAVQLGAALDRAEAERELRVRAELDVVTGLPNRWTLLRHLDLLRLDPREPCFVLLLIDLDDFKKINESLGHEAGDQLLVQIARRLTSKFRDAEFNPGDSAVISRVGGDEFAVVLAGTEGVEKAMPIVEQIQELLRQPYTLLGRTVFVSGSVGVNFGQGEVTSAQDLLRDADTAMYKAKTRGASRYEIFHRGMHAEALEKLHLDAQLRLAMETNELELHYQPIVQFQSRKEAGVEALIRWRHPEQGLISPGRFLPIAEAVGLNIPLSEWVIRRACADAVRFRSAAGSDLYVNINVPPDHIKHPGFVEFIQQTLTESGLDPKALGIEIVENTLLDDSATCTLVLTRLRELGVRIAIDDFGTGYSNLSYLRDYPVGTLKIDREFVKNVPGSLRDNGLARAIILMGQALGLSIVAEGIETPEQYQFFEEAGCDYVQGFLISTPLEPVAYLERLCQSQSEPPPMYTRRSEHPSQFPEFGMS